ncbi:hypothetical protein F5Y09DRAFT_87184 [Xylaria sp. FL1042]|nr:hypothetical protein F5Y09DRAFT_87184 [Xylaria sp. FL1042]
MQLAQSAKEVAKDIFALLADMQIKGRKTKWKSFLVAVKEVRNQESVTSITSSLTRLQTHMTLHLQFQIKGDIASLQTEIQKLQSISDRLQLNKSTELEKLRADLLSAFNTIATAGENQRGKQEGGWEKTLILDFKRLTMGDFHTISQGLPSYQSKVSSLSQGIDSIADDQAFIESFYFDRFATREAKITESHAKTFEWVFYGISPDRKTKIGFPGWLKYGNGIFWIRGKAGSGKSTLMKFISHHPSTLQYLKCWSGSQQLVMGRFYFWNSGTDLQKSQEGLLRSLIFEVLRQCPELITHVRTKLSRMTTQHMPVWAPQRNDDNASLWEGWMLRQLVDILGRILSHDESKRFFFIIDGLDEYISPHTQDHQDLVNAIRKLAASPQVKICVSSRPWTVYMDAFSGDIHQCLKLEDLTKDDIRSYTTDKFLAHNQYRKLLHMNPGYSSLVESVVTKSQGVFLWVFLVVRELLDGFTYSDTLNIMRRRLDSFPSTLERFFQHMLDSVPEVYRPQTAQIFQVSVSYRDSLPMIFYSFMGDINDDPDLIAQETHPPMNMPEVLERRDTMRRRLDAW